MAMYGSTYGKMYRLVELPHGVTTLLKVDTTWLYKAPLLGKNG